nr:ABC transporter permease [Kibdelosporangium sp. MJ126-NF4]CEL23038.1 putative transmembrane transport protein [Kibdelosporangium sp. MJ126-NF4]CTQ90177.1 putative transmembrane transport protein [Kibdelosporangium sp. MJ126-NF4]
MTATLTTARRGGGGLRGMVWVTWRQHRWPIILGVATVALAAVVVFQAASLIGQFPGSAECRTTQQGCGPVLGLFDPFSIWNGYLEWVLPMVPVVLAVFLGAPLLAREYEQRTYLMVWSQDVSPARWLLTKLGLLAGISVVIGAALGALGAYLTLVVKGHSPRMSLFDDGERFEASPLLLVGYTLFGIAVGVAASAVIRRTVPAMAATIGVFVLVRFAVVQWRPHYLPPLVASEPVTNVGMGPAWNRLYSERFPDKMFVDAGCVDSSGQFTSNIEGTCPERVAMLYHPSERLLTFRLIETAIFLLLTAVLVVFVWRRIRARNAV